MSTADLFDPAIRVDDPPAPAPAGDATARRGYPLPPWAREFMARRPSGEELERWLTTLSSDERRAYLDALLERLELAGERSSTCLVEAHVEDLADLRPRVDELRHELATVREEANDALRDAYRAGMSDGRDQLVGVAGRMADVEPLVVVVPLHREAIGTVDPAVVGAQAAEAAERALINRRVELEDEELVG